MKKKRYRRLHASDRADSSQMFRELKIIRVVGSIRARACRTEHELAYFFIGFLSVCVSACVSQKIALMPIVLKTGHRTICVIPAREPRPILRV